MASSIWPFERVAHLFWKNKLWCKWRSISFFFFSFCTIFVKQTAHTACRFKCRFSIVDISESTVHTLHYYHLFIYSVSFRARYSHFIPLTGTHSVFVDIQFMANMLTQTQLTASCAQTTNCACIKWIGCHLVVWHQWIRYPRVHSFLEAKIAVNTDGIAQHGTLLCSHQPNQSTKTKLFD